MRRYDNGHVVPASYLPILLHPSFPTPTCSAAPFNRAYITASPLSPTWLQKTPLTSTPTTMFTTTIFASTTPSTKITTGIITTTITTMTIITTITTSGTVGGCWARGRRVAVDGDGILGKRWQQQQQQQNLLSE